MPDFPRSIAIAGAWGYIGRQLLDAALAEGLEVNVLDPGQPPGDVDVARLTVWQDEASFYQQPVDLFHLALHPEHRATALRILLARAANEPLLVLNEKPMAEPEHPEQCAAAEAAAAGTRVVMLYDFLELFDPMIHAVGAYLRRFDRVEIERLELYRGKDREDPGRPRNYKRMVHIQYQETVHCLAFLLYVLGVACGSLRGVLADGVRVEARSEPYAPPNPEAYPYVVDGRCDYRIDFGGTRVEGCTNFRRGAEFAKRKVIEGRVEGRPFRIEANTQEGEKYLRIDGVDQGFPPEASSYRLALGTLGRWYQTVDHGELMAGPYPHPRFARLTYQLSSALWRSCVDQRPLALGSAGALLGFQAGFAEAARAFPRYPPRS